MPEGIGPLQDYDELVRSIVSALHRRDLEGNCANWISATELELFRDCDVRPGDQMLSGTFVGGETQIDFPYGMQRPVKLELTQGQNRWTPTIVSLDELGRLLEEADGLVRGVTVWGDALLLAPTPLAGVTYRLFYFGLPAPLSRQNKTTRIFEMGWDAYLYGSLVLAAAHIGDDERAAVWAALFAQRKASLKRAIWRSRAGGGVLVQRPDFQVYDRHTEESAI